MYAKTLGRSCPDDVIEAMAEAGYWVWSLTGPHVVWADLPDHKRERWRMGARAVPETGPASPRKVYEAHKANIFVPTWGELANPQRQRWGRVTEAMVRARDGVPA